MHGCTPPDGGSGEEGGKGVNSKDGSTALPSAEGNAAGRRAMRGSEPCPERGPGLFADESLAHAGRCVPHTAPGFSGMPGGKDVPCEARLLLPEQCTGRGGEGLPGVLLLHEYTGLGGYLLRHAERLAAAGYAVLCADLYGRDARPADRAQASQCAGPLRADRGLLRQRALAGLKALAAQPEVDAQRLLAVGFSFGGCAALELARSGAALRGVASVYGYLATTLPAAPGAVRCPVLVHHGAHDRVVPLDDLKPFVREMADGGVDCRVVVHAGAGHGFCNAALATPDEAAGSWYCPVTEARAWGDVLRFFGECLG